MKHIKLLYRTITAIGHDGDNYILGCISKRNQRKICLYKIGQENEIIYSKIIYNWNWCNAWYIPCKEQVYACFGTQHGGTVHLELVPVSLAKQSNKLVEVKTRYKLRIDDYLYDYRYEDLGDEFNENYFLWIFRHSSDQNIISKFVGLFVSDDYAKQIEKMKMGEVLLINRRTKSMRIFTLPWGRSREKGYFTTKIAPDNLTFAVAKNNGELFVIDIDI